MPNCGVTTVAVFGENGGINEGSSINDADDADDESDDASND